MHRNMTKVKLDELKTQLRIMILQNVREEEEYDERFLHEMNRITHQILELKSYMKNEKIGVSRINHQFAKTYNLQY